MTVLPDEAVRECVRLALRLAPHAPLRARRILEGCQVLRPHDPAVRDALLRCREGRQ